VAHPQVAAFARTADGGAKPTRSIAGQNTQFTRTIHDMAYDPIKDEILVPQFFAFAILTFKGDANGNVPPVRKIFGPSTQLKNPQALALDWIHGEIFVPQNERVLVFSRETNGDSPPLRILGDKEHPVDGGRLTVDPIHDFLIASADDGLKIYRRTASGTEPPLRIITHKDAKEVGLMTTHPESGMIFAGVRPGGRYEKEDYVGVWSVFDNGDVPARWAIGGPGGMLSDMRGVAIDAKNKSVIISDKTVNGVMTYRVPEVFDNITR
jgi:hypothetical protein